MPKVPGLCDIALAVDQSPIDVFPASPGCPFAARIPACKGKMIALRSSGHSRVADTDCDGGCSRQATSPPDRPAVRRPYPLEIHSNCKKRSPSRHCPLVFHIHVYSSGKNTPSEVAIFLVPVTDPAAIYRGGLAAPAVVRKIRHLKTQFLVCVYRRVWSAV